MMRPDKPASTVRRAKKLRRAMTKPEIMIWQYLRVAPHEYKFRKQHPVGPYILDFFCARANLAIEIDGISHDMGDRPYRDERRDIWLREHRIDTLRIQASDVLRDVIAVVNNILTILNQRMVEIGKAHPSAVPSATSPLQVNGEGVKGNL